MRVCATSDLHGQLPEVPPCDLLLVAGDVCPADDHSLARQGEFFMYEFPEWAGRQPARRAAWIAGNHDHLLYRFSPEDVEKALQGMPPWWTYLRDGAGVFEGVSVFGTPWSLGPDVDGWAFEAQEPGMGPRYEKPGAVSMEDVVQDIPDSVDIVVSHGPPSGFGDRVGGSLSFTNVWLGSEALTRRLREVEPLLCVFGHNHEGHGRWDFPGRDGRGMTLANVSALTDRYVMRRDGAVTTFELEV